MGACRYDPDNDLAGLDLYGSVVAIPRVHDVDDPAQVVEAGELDRDLALGLAEVDLDAGLEAVGEAFSQLLETGGDGLLAQDARSRLLLAAERDDLLQSPHGDALCRDPGGEPVLETGVVDGEEGTGMSGREDAGRDATLDGRGQLQQPQRVGDLRPRAADALGELLVRAAEVLEQLAVGGRLLERVELRAVKVLQQRVAEHVVVVGLAHDRGDRVATGLLGGAPATLAHDQLVRVLARAAYDDGLQEADLLDRVHQLGERLLLEDLTRLAGVRTDLRDGQLREVGAGDRAVRGLGPVDDCSSGRRRLVRVAR